MISIVFGFLCFFAYPQGQTNPQQSGPQYNFKIMTKGELRDVEGLHLSFTSYMATDGTGLMHIYNEFDSPDEARQYLEKQLHNVTRIVYRGEEKNETGKTIGLRAEVLIFSSDSKREAPSVYWTNGSNFHQILGDSFKEIIQLEDNFTY
ncbi:MAG: hypothetical protein WA748_20060 [Candidatus Acidiferrum sp.]